MEWPHCEMADVIAIVADGIAMQVGMLVRLILLPLWQMEWPLGHFYFSLSSVLLSRTSSHI